MNREFKFRAWTGHKMEYTVLAGLSKGYFLNINEYCVTSYETSHIMQYTGLKDVHGTDIYEGDICILRRNGGFRRKGTIVEIVWSNTELNYYFSGGGQLTKNKKVEVIGNIYENPELLD